MALHMPGASKTGGSSSTVDGARSSNQRWWLTERQEEELMFYPTNSARGPLHLLLYLLNPSHPRSARMQLERLYWESWRVVVMAWFLSVGGTLLFAMAIVCSVVLGDSGRSAVLCVAAGLLCLPGYYGLFNVVMFLRGKKGYSLQVFPGA